MSSVKDWTASVIKQAEIDKYLDGGKDFIDEEQIFADIQDMEDATIRFYVYQKELACVELEAAGDIYQVIFHGGDYRTQNMEILVNGAVVCTIEGTLAGDEESITVDLSGNHVEVTYNRSTEAYDIKSENTYEKIEMNGSLSVGSKEIRLLSFRTFTRTFLLSQALL